MFVYKRHLRLFTCHDRLTEFLSASLSAEILLEFLPILFPESFPGTSSSFHSWVYVPIAPGICCAALSEISTGVSLRILREFLQIFCFPEFLQRMILESFHRNFWISCQNSIRYFSLNSLRNFLTRLCPRFFPKLKIKHKKLSRKPFKLDIFQNVFRNLKLFLENHSKFWNSSKYLS